MGGPSDPPARSLGDLPLSLRVREAASAFGVSNSTMYELVRRGDIRSFKLGSAIRVPRSELERLLGAVNLGADDPFEDAGIASNYTRIRNVQPGNRGVRRRPQEAHSEADAEPGAERGVEPGTFHDPERRT